MKIHNILNTTQHRTWDLPIARWSYYQEWNNVIFLHWKVEMKVLKKFVPDELEIDLFEGNPWVSVVAFTMQKVRPRCLPSLSQISNFHELNFRTYIKSGEKSGVYFLSIEAGKKLSCFVAKYISNLPYRFATIKRTQNKYESLNTNLNDCLKIKFKILYKITDKIELDKWLIERYALYQDTSQSINEFEIHHMKWPLNEIELDQLEINYHRFNELLNSKPDRAHYSKGVQVVAWGKNKIKKFDLKR